MGRPKKSVVAAKKAAEKKNSPAVKNQRTVVDGVALVKKFHELVLDDYSDDTLMKSDRMGAYFTTWLNSNGLSLDALAEVADRRNGQPVMDAAVVTLWVETRVGNVKTARASKAFVILLSLWLRRNGWDASQLDGRSPSGKKVRNAIDAMCAHKPKHIKTQARPYTPQEIDSIIAAIDANTFDWNDLTVQAMRTYVILGFAMAMRGGELCHTLLWNMVDTDGEVFNLPGGKVFKHQDKPATLPIPHNHSPKKACGPNCPVATLKAWKKTCEEHGIPTTDTLVFPAIRQKEGWDHGSTVAVFGDQAFLSDPVARSVALKGDTPKSRELARAGQHVRYRTRWKEACEAAGINADHQWERVSTHGMRRGAATTAVRNGISEVIVAIRLRQNGIETTSNYIKREAADTTSLNHISPTQNETLAGTEMVSADALRKTCDALPKTCQVTHNGKCEVEHNGTACGKPFSAHIRIDGVSVAACEQHRRRSLEGKTGDALSKPIRAWRSKSG